VVANLRASKHDRFHLQRMPQNRIPLKPYHYSPQGNRTIGRPKKRWREQLQLWRRNGPNGSILDVYYDDDEVHLSSFVNNIVCQRLNGKNSVGTSGSLSKVTPALVVVLRHGKKPSPRWKAINYLLEKFMHTFVVRC
jgi:hypothetical protein